MKFKAALNRLSSLEAAAGPKGAPLLYADLATLLGKKKSRKMWPIIKAVLEKKPTRVLDIGCGYGAVAIYLALCGIEVVGIDLIAERLQEAQALAEELGINNASFLRMDACDITLSGFDAALSTDFFEHLPYECQPKHLQSVRQALNDGGMYFIRTPHRSNIRQQKSKGHIGLGSFAGIARQAAEAGFSIRFNIAHLAVASPVHYHIFVERWLESRQWSPLSIYKALQKCGLANVLAQLKKQ